MLHWIRDRLTWDSFAFQDTSTCRLAFYNPPSNIRWFLWFVCSLFSTLVYSYGPVEKKLKLFLGRIVDRRSSMEWLTANLLRSKISSHPSGHRRVLSGWYSQIFTWKSSESNLMVLLQPRSLKSHVTSRLKGTFSFI